MVGYDSGVIKFMHYNVFGGMLMLGLRCKYCLV